MVVIQKRTCPAQSLCVYWFFSSQKSRHPLGLHSACHLSSDKLCDPVGLVQCPNSWIPPKSVGEGARSLFGGWPGSLENVSCSSATPDLHRCNLGVAPVQETFSRLSGHPPKRLLAPSPTDLGGIQEFGHCTRPVGSQDKLQNCIRIR